jgi:O-antigen ligase
MTILLICFLLFIFWLENSLDIGFKFFKGLSLFNLSIYLLMLQYLYLAIKRRKVMIANKLNAPLLVYVYIAIVSIPIKIVYDEVPIYLMGEIVDFKNWLEPYLLFFIVYNIVRDEKTCRVTIAALLVMVFLTSLMAPLTSLGYGPGSYAAFAGHEGRASGFATMNVNGFAMYLVLFIPFVLSNVLFQRTKWLKMINIILLLTAFTALIIAGSRGGFICMIAAMMYYLFSLKRFRIIKTHTIIFVLAVITVGTIVSFLLAPEQVQETVAKRIDIEETDSVSEYTSGRTEIIPYGWKYFLESPIYGHGFQTFGALVEREWKFIVAHNAILNNMVQFGLVGLIAFCWIFVRLYLTVAKQLKTAGGKMTTAPLYVSFGAGLLGNCLGMLNGDFEGPLLIVFYVLTAVVLKYIELENSGELNHPYRDALDQASAESAQPA